MLQRHLPILCLAAVATASRGVAWGAASPPRTTELRPGQSSSCTLGIQETRSFALRVEGNHYAELLVHQEGIDAELQLRPAGQPGATETRVNEEGIEFGDEVMRVVAPAAGATYEFTVHGLASHSPNGRGRCEVRWLLSRPATDRDRQAEELQRKYAGAANAAGRRALAADWAKLTDLRGELFAILNGTEPGPHRFTKEDGERAVELAKQLNDTGLLAIALREAGTAHITDGSLERGFEQLETSFGLTRRHRDVWGETFLLIRTGSLYRVIGSQERGLELFRRALPNARQFAARNRLPDDSSLLRSVLLSIGGALNGLGRAEEAVPFLEESLALYRKVQDRRNEAQLLGMLGRSYANGGRFGKAQDYYEQSLRLARETQESLLVAQSASNLAMNFYNAGEYDRAIELLDESANLRLKNGNRLSVPNELAGLALSEAGRKNREKSLEYARRALEMQNQIQARVSSSQLRSSSQSAARSTYASVADALLLADELQPDPALVAEALELSENGRARAFLHFLHTAHIDALRLASPELAAKEASLSQDLEANARRQSQARLAGNETALKQLESEFHALSRELEANRDQIRRSAPGLETNHLSVLPWAEIQKSVLGPDDALVEYQVGRWRSYAWVGTREGLAVYRLPGRAKIDEAVDRFVAAIRLRETGASPQSEAPAAAKSRIEKADADIQRSTRALAELLIRPLQSPLLSKRRWLLSLDESLHTLSFPALLAVAPDSLAAGGAKAPEEIIHIQSASALHGVRRSRAAAAAGQVPPAQVDSIAIVADPVFDAADKRPEAGPITNRVSATRGSITPEVWKPRRLPFARREANAIVRLAGSRPSLLATGFDANRELVVSGKLNNYGIVHFATHGIVNTEFPELSGVALSNFDREGRVRDGMLRLQDMFRLRLNANLVLLSACDTARGVLQRGDGVMSITRGMLSAGARQVVSTLWKVDDAATAEFMRLFYEAYFSDAKPSAASALAIAQQNLARDSRFLSPYFWGAFVLTGDAP